MIVFREESYRIIGACFEVYKDKGNGFLEAVYQECLAIELRHQGIPSMEQPRLRLAYKGHVLAREYLPDFLCFDRIIVEVKAVRKLTGEHRAQLFNYLKAAGQPLGILVNFGHHPNLEYQRFLNPSLRDS